MTLADDVVLCTREKDVLELELEQWREALEKRGMKVSRAKTKYMCLNITQTRNARMQSAQLISSGKHHRATDTGVNKRTQCGRHNWRKVSGVLCNKRTQCGRHNWRKMSGVLCNKRTPPHVREFKMIAQPAMLYGMETLPMTSSHMKRLGWVFINTNS